MTVSTTEAVLDISELSLAFPTYHGEVQALDRVSIAVHPGEIVGVVGESGSGKTVTAMTAMQLLSPNSFRITGGRVSVLGRDIFKLDQKQLGALRGNDVSMIFQEPMTALNPTIKIGRQLQDIIVRHQSIGRKKAGVRAEQLLESMRINNPAEVMKSYPHRLSGGMRQRVLIAMAFSCTPKLLIADEPTTALDVSVQAQILTLIREMSQKSGTAVLFITHDMGVVRTICKRIYVMYSGRVIETGKTATVLDEPAHPYTRALLSALPERNPRKQSMAVIEGMAPSLIDPPQGCRFAPRCTLADADCAQQPQMLAVNGQPEHEAACWKIPSPEAGEE